MPSNRRAAVSTLCIGLSACGEPTDDLSFPASGSGNSSDAEDTALPTDQPCPTGMIAIAGGIVDLGERAPDRVDAYAGTIIPSTTVRLQPYCMDRFPLPGEAGDDWPLDGLTWSQVEALAEILPAYGRRLCTVAELMLGAAGPDNWRLPYDPSDYTSGLCDIEGNTPSALGAYEACESPLGFRDFMVRSSWAELDRFTASIVRPNRNSDFPGDGSLAIYGGTAATDTFYAPSNFGIHFYGPGDPAYNTDGLRTCASTGVLEPALNDAWQTRTRALARNRSFADWVETLSGDAASR